MTKTQTCKTCGSKFTRAVRFYDGECKFCHEDKQRQMDIDGAVKWAVDVLARPDTVILDSETTGFTGEIIELAIIGIDGTVLYNGRFCPAEPVQYGALQCHGISDDQLKDEPTWPEQHDQIASILEGKKVLIYNARFDKARYEHTCEAWGVQPVQMKDDCVMEQYAIWFNQRKARGKGYRWQKLNGGHSALSDCQATLKVIQRMTRKRN